MHMWRLSIPSPELVVHRSAAPQIHVCADALLSLPQQPILVHPENLGTSACELNPNS